MVHLTRFGLRSSHWGVIALLAVVHFLLTWTLPTSGSNASLIGYLAGAVLFSLAFATVVVYLLAKLYRFVQLRPSRWAAVVLLAALHVLLDPPSPPASSSRESAMGYLFGSLFFSLVFATGIVYLLRKLYRVVQDR